MKLTLIVWAGELDITGLSDIEFRKNAFEALELPNMEKSLLKAFLHHDDIKDSGWVDIVPTKGKGIIILLCGPPGVGKTLTAESLAEDCKKPLYSLSASDIEKASADQRLVEALDCCELWKAVLLLDEADVFLQARSATNLEQNQLVSGRNPMTPGLTFLCSPS